MHGRLKVKTPAEQQEAKKLEREKKITKYKEGMKQLIALRGCSEPESMKATMQLTGALLTANSDLYTLWNQRKEIFQRMEETSDEEQIQSLYTTELDFIEATLVNNPKSYCLWEHRVFCMRRMPEPNWTRELRLTSKFLEYDERNFHCWDYRRFVVAASPKSASAEDELNFTFDKISNNFSNYSSWHYRSKLLPLVYPDDDCLHGIKEKALLQEFEHTMNAVFTDPNDQSAWFYHRWLLGRKDRPDEVDLISVARVGRRRGGLDGGPVGDALEAGPGRAVLVFSKPVKVGDSVVVKVSVDGVIVSPSNLNFATPSSNKHSNIWFCDIPGSYIDEASPHEISFETEFVASSQGAQSSLTLPPGVVGVTYRRYKETLRGKTTLFRHELSAAQHKILVAEMESCQQLLELEPGNKWTLLTLIHLTRALDPLAHQTAILSYIDQLLKVDPAREGFYWDFRSKYLMENAVEKLPVRQDILDEDSSVSSSDHPAPSTVDLSASALTSVYHALYLTGSPSVDLSRNRLRHVEALAQFQNVARLDLARNEIRSCEGLQFLPALKELDLSNNDLRTLDSLSSLKGCENLTILTLTGNPVTKDSELTEWIRVHLPGVECRLA